MHSRVRRGSMAALATLTVGELAYPLTQRRGRLRLAAVRSAGERVERGDVVARPLDAEAVPIHAARGGVVRGIETRPAPDRAATCASVIIDVDDDPQPRASRLPAWPDWHSRSPEELVARVRDAGIAGLGGAAYSAAEKLYSALRAARDEGAGVRLILNGLECEPPIGCDQALLAGSPDAVVSGGDILARIVGAPGWVLALGAGRSGEAGVARATGRARGRVAVRFLDARYPAGDERLLAAAVAATEVGVARRALDLGAVVFNVATAAAIHRAVVGGEPLEERIVTVTGDAVPRPANLVAPLGASLGALLHACGVREPGSVVVGGLMMGVRPLGPDAPVGPSTNCIVATRVLPVRPESAPCIRCGRCADACPYRLSPQILYADLAADLFHRVDPGSLDRCTLCGQCAYVCPSRIPLVGWLDAGKRRLEAAREQRARTERARRRYEARRRRLASEPPAPMPREELSAALARARARASRAGE